MFQGEDHERSSELVYRELCVVEFVRAQSVRREVV